MSLLDPVQKLPIHLVFSNLPAYPVQLADVPATLARLAIRDEQSKQAKQSLTDVFTIGGVTATGYNFLFSDTPTASVAARDTLHELVEQQPGRVLLSLLGVILRERGNLFSSSLSRLESPIPLPLETPEQFAIGWASLPDVRSLGLPLLPAWSLSLTNAAAASRLFWPMIAEHGSAYNLLILEQVDTARATLLQARFGPDWPAEAAAALAESHLYVIDMSRFEAVEPHVVGGAPRFTPATITLLVQNPTDKTLMPLAVLVAQANGAGRTVFHRRTATTGAWLYALQAAKVSITVYGVWLGHVYHWHLVTAALLMTMFNTLRPSHPVAQLLTPQSNYLIPFNDVLLLLWGQIAPPTSISTPFQFLVLANQFATNRSFFDDDPIPTLARFGIHAADFTDATPWDRYPIVRGYLAIWSAVEDYATACVAATYADDAAVVADLDLQTWIATSADADDGNIHGLPPMNGRQPLAAVLASLIYRITIHGVSRLNRSANPALTFVANFPHCLHRTDIPAPTVPLDTRTLLTYLPNTESIGEALNFYFTFAFSPPYVPLIPLAGIETNLFFTTDPTDPRNQALIRFRHAIAAFIANSGPDVSPQLYQWPLNIET